LLELRQSEEQLEEARIERSIRGRRQHSLRRRRLLVSRVPLPAARRRCAQRALEIVHLDVVELTGERPTRRSEGGGERTNGENGEVSRFTLDRLRLPFALDARTEPLRGLKEDELALLPRLVDLRRLALQ
jgi:hypothetical protein